MMKVEKSVEEFFLDLHQSLLSKEGSSKILPLGYARELEGVSNSSLARGRLGGGLEIVYSITSTI
jgi:hypothetical protein